jgi:hypothetical protein
VIDVLPRVAAGVLWATLLYKLRALQRTPGNAALRSLCSAFAAFALALTVDLPPVYASVDAVVGEPNFAQLLGHSLALVGGWATQSAVLRFLYAGEEAAARTRRRAVVLLVALGAMTWFFVLAPVDRETTSFTTTYASAPYVVGFWFAYLGYLSFALVDVARLSWRYAGVAGPGFTSSGLRLLALGSLCGLAYVAHKAFFLGVSSWTELVLPAGPNTVISRVAVTLCFSLVAIGTTLPTWGPRLQHARGWSSRYRTYHRLYPLWSALHAASPDIALARPRRPMLDALDPRDLDFRLYRRIIEIRDGRLDLRPYLDPAVAARARAAAAASGLTGEALEAAVEAAILTAALAAKRAGHPAHDGRTPPVTGASDVAGELAWLEQVARFFPAPAPATLEPGVATSGRGSRG